MSLMPLGDLTKQLAAEAIRSATAPKPTAPPQPETAGATILAQIQAMQKAVKEDEELLVLFRTGADTVRVVEFFFPSWRVAVLTGQERGGLSRIVTPVELLQLTCRVTKVQPPAAPLRVKFVTPKT
ncbi:MAG TPA: hypothetical protein VMT86_17450 [Bryobacteraceae bacterium]|nr:hypothetical protein [Bryobacteraceae bacterium]